MKRSVKRSKHTVFHWLLVAIRALIEGVLLVTLWVAVLLAGVIFYNVLYSPLNFIVGVPLILIGITMGLSSLYELIAGIVSWDYSKAHCPVCRSSTDPKKILSPEDGIIG